MAGNSLSVLTSQKENCKDRDGDDLVLYNSRIAHLASIACLAGGMIQILYGLLAIPFPYGQTDYGWDELLWALATVGMIGAALGLVALDVARPRWLAVLGATLSILGNMLRIVVSALLIREPSDAYVPLILISIVLVLLGMCMLGIATLLGKQLTGWHAWMPLLAGLFTLIPVAVYSISLFLHFILLGVWGILWFLIGYTVYTRTTRGLAPEPANR